MIDMDCDWEAVDLMGGKRGNCHANHDVAPGVSSSCASGLEKTNSVARKTLKGLLA